MATLNSVKAKLKIKAILAAVGVSKAGVKPVATMTGGKLYELFVLSNLMLHLAARGYSFQFSSATIAFKTGGGPIKSTDFHVDVIEGATKVVGKIFTDVEVRTLGLNHISDYSQYHETDIVVVTPSTIGFPTPQELLLGIECKATAKFLKSHVREALGRRRALSYLHHGLLTKLNGGPVVHANPPSEYWLAFIDPTGKNYVQGPAMFSVELIHLQP